MSTPLTGQIAFEKELTFLTPIGAGWQNIRVRNPVIPAQHARSELAICYAGAMLPGEFGPGFHHAQRHGIRLVIVTPIFGRFVDRHSLQHRMSFPVISQSLDQLSPGARLLIKHQVLDRQQRIHCTGKGDRLDGHSDRGPPVHVLACSAQPRTVWKDRAKANRWRAGFPRDRTG